MNRILLYININGLLLLLLAIFMPLGIPFSLYHGDDDIGSLLLATLITGATGLMLWLLSGGLRINYSQVRKRDGYVIVFLGWLLITTFGALPYTIHGIIPSYTDAFFETMSGFTTTGASILNDIEAVPHGLLFWRSMTHWLGGMGVIVLTLAVLPLLGVGGAQLFVAEMAGPNQDKIHPQVAGTAKRLWGIYVLLTITQTILLMFGGMSFFDAICHAFGTMSTGGFSTRQDSVAAFDSPYLQYIIIIFMFLGGTNFALHYHAMHGRLKAYLKDEEFRFYLVITSFMIALVTAIVYFYTPAGTEQSFRDSTFQVVSLITSTGFVSADYEKWAPYTSYIFLVLLFTGACAGSTTGSLKMIRLLVLIKNGFLELKRLIHPNAVVPIRINGKMLPRNVIDNILAFFALYMIIFLVSSLIMSFEPAFIDSTLVSSMSSVAATLGCMGPGLGAVGPVNNYAAISDWGKWFLSFLMLLGRLEIFTIFIIFSPSFWKA